jgi:ammonium transporter, Amt family
MNAADSAWMLISTALVLFMVPGLALFYGGLVAEKNVIGMMAESFVAIGVVSVLWVVVGYPLAFGADHNGLIGGLGHVMLRGVGATPSPWDPHVPGLLFVAYQGMFAVITPALITGAFTGRMHFRGYLAFIALWSLLVYCPFTHWVWGGGFLGASGLGAVDFAGGAVVHETAGAGALAAVLYLGRRRDADRPHNVPLVLLGAGILWFGWFGFNAGSAGNAGPVATSALVNTQLGASAGMVVWMAVEWIRRKKPSSVGLATGAVAGLAAITPAAGYVPAWASLVIGAAAGVVCYEAVQLKYRLRYDDALDVVGVHMVAGVIGVLLTGVFASLAVNAVGVDSGLTQIGRQFVLVAIGLVYPFVMTMVILLLVEKLVGLRVDPDEQAFGLDFAEYGESGYMLDLFAGPALKLGLDRSGLSRSEQGMREATAPLRGSPSGDFRTGRRPKAS